MPFIAIAVALTVLLGGGAYASQTETGQAALESVTHLWADADVTTETETEGSLNLSTDGSASFGETRLAEDHDEGVTDPNTVGGDAYIDINVDGSLKVN